MLTSFKKRLSKTLNRAGEILTGVGTSPIKQFKNAIIDGDEEKAISIYTAEDNEKPLYVELDPSKPFPSTKKATSPDIPLHLASKFAHYKLVLVLLNKGGDPSTINIRKESCLHAVCSGDSNPEVRAEILSTLVHWDKNNYDRVSVNQVDVEGNTAIHYAANHGLLSCVEKLVALGAIISIVNKNNNTCCELADESGHKQLASMLELALVFQPVEEEMEQFDREQTFPYENQPGRLFVTSFSLTLAGLASFIEESISSVCDGLTGQSSNEIMNRARAEVLLQKYNWDTIKVQVEYLSDREKVLAAAHLTPEAPAPLLEDGTIITEAAKSSDTAVGDLELDAIDFSLNETDEIQHGEPTTLEICTICGEEMLRAAKIDLFLNGSISEPTSRELRCMSGHGYCVSCWSSYQTVQVRDNGAACLQCPGVKCGEILDIRWAPVLLQTPELVERFKAQRLRSIQDCRGLKSCNNESCELCLHLPSMDPKEESDKSLGHGIPLSAICSNGHGFCLSCSLQCHSPCACGQMQKWLQQVQEETKLVSGDVSGDDIANALWVAANTKRCPRCNTPIEKDEGCNHMSCRKCRKEFCWICMQDWSLHSDNTGGYFQCNKFVENSNPKDSVAESSSGGGDSAVLDILWAEERGNAHAETMRLRERGKRMARFIHYFTRYQAHGESVKMETKMKLETIDRISSGLKACANATGLYPEQAQSSNLKASGEPPMIWLQGKAVENPILSKGAPFSQLKAPATVDCDDILSNHYHLPEECLRFLSEGFDELLKCRMFLQWSYPYAYFEFNENDESESRSRNWRRSKYQQDHRLSFETLQSDLEAMIETLSDVVARRRLRASRSQIHLATRAAKSKRVEFEYLLISYAVTKASLSDGGNAAMFGDVPSSYRHHHNSSRNRRVVPSWRLRLQERLAQQDGNYWQGQTPPRQSRLNSLREGDISDEESDELAAFLYSQAAANNLGSTTPLQDRERDLDELNSLFEVLNGISASNSPVVTAAASSATESASGSPSPGRGQSSSTTHLHIRRDSGTGGQLRRRKPSKSRRSNSSNATNELDGESSANAADTATTDGVDNIEEDGKEIGESNAEGEEWEDLSPDEIPRQPSLTPIRNQNRLNNTPATDATPSVADSRSRITELSELNRAILLSLQESASSPPSNSTAAEASGSASAPSESDIELLVSMGFSRDQALQALRESRGNVELAANRLLEAH